MVEGVASQMTPFYKNPLGKSETGPYGGHIAHLPLPLSTRSRASVGPVRPAASSSKASAERSLRSSLTLVRIREGLPILAFRCSSAERSVEFGQRGLARTQLSLIQIDERFLGQP